MRAGVWSEVVTIAAWSTSLHGFVLLFAFISPIARASIHLSIRERIMVLLTGSFFAAGICVWIQEPLLFIPILVYVFVTAYSSLIASLLQERRQSQRLIGLSKFEKEQMIRDHERVRISRELHDTMGHYWTAVIRTIDVAEVVDWPEKQLFIQKARVAAEKGLEEMRKIVHGSHGGKKTPEHWMEDVKNSIERLKELTHIEIEVTVKALKWEKSLRRVEIAEWLARTMIESLTNAIRHGKAERVLISLIERDDQLSLTIQDNGVGFVGLKEGMGLQSIKELTNDLAGDFQIKSERHKGTTVQLTLTLEGDVLDHD